jgi:hypothetical protein
MILGDITEAHLVGLMSHLLSVGKSGDREQPVAGRAAVIQLERRGQARLGVIARFRWRAPAPVHDRVGRAWSGCG